MGVNSNKLTTIPKELSQLKNLTQVHVTFNKIKHVHPAIKNIIKHGGKPFHCFGIDMLDDLEDLHDY